MFGQLETLGEKRRTIDALEAEWLEDVADYDRSEGFRADGFQSAASALRTECRLDAGVAHMYVNVARKLEKLPVVADAFLRGEISLRHASVVANAYTAERAAEISNLETEFVDAALKQPPHELRGLVQYATDAIDGDGGAADDDTMHKRRRYHGSTTLNGMYAFDGLGDPETGRIHRTAIESEMDRFIDNKQVSVQRTTSEFSTFEILR